MKDKPPVIVKGAHQPAPGGTVSVIVSRDAAERIEAMRRGAAALVQYNETKAKPK